jgi:hypothetical protein
MLGSGILIVHVIILLWVGLELWTFTWHEKSSVGCVYGNTGRAILFGAMAFMFACTQLVYMYYDYFEQGTNYRVGRRDE